MKELHDYQIKIEDAYPNAYHNLAMTNAILSTLRLALRGILYQRMGLVFPM